MNANDVFELVEMMGEYLPVVKKATPLLIKAGKEINPLLESMTDAFVDLTVRSIKRYEAAGMSRKEAILLSLNAKVAINDALKSMKRN